MPILPDMVGMVSNDMAATLRFYRLLGLDIPHGVEHETHVEITTSNGYRLAWDTKQLMQELYPDWVEPVGQRMNLAFLCESPAEVDQVYQRMIDAGYTSVTLPWDAFWGQRYAVVRDPDGNSVDLFAYLADR